MLRKQTIVLLIVLMCGLIAVPAFSQVSAGDFDLGIFGGGYRFEGNQPIKADAWALGISAGYAFTDNWGVELSLTGVDAETKETDDDIDTMLYRMDGLYHFNLTESLVPYLSAGIGGIHMDPKGYESQDDFLVNYGGGLKYFVTDNIALRADIRHIVGITDNHDFFKVDGHYNNMLYTVGLDFRFGRKCQKAVKEEPPAPEQAAVAVILPPDDDSDGIPNDQDKCWKTPAGVKVDKYGCPVDTDMDGVADYLDQCKDTPKTVRVDEKGCPVDSDKDGVTDDLDVCANTPAGASVDERGCWVIRNINFQSGKAELAQASQKEIDGIVDILKKNPGLTISVEGHTDSTGNEKFNQVLSEKRADAIRLYVIDKGIPAERITSKGYGEARPIADNDTPEGRLKNRRVEIRPVE